MWHGGCRGRLTAVRGGGGRTSRWQERAGKRPLQGEGRGQQAALPAAPPPRTAVTGSQERLQASCRDVNQVKPLEVTRGVQQPPRHRVPSRTWSCSPPHLRWVASNPAAVRLMWAATHGAPEIQGGQTCIAVGARQSLWGTRFTAACGLPFAPHLGYTFPQLGGLATAATSPFRLPTHASEAPAPVSPSPWMRHGRASRKTPSRPFRLAPMRQRRRGTRPRWSPSLIKLGTPSAQRRPPSLPAT